jgi:hypothetical protein
MTAGEGNGRSRNMTDTDFFDDDLTHKRTVTRQARETGSGVHYDELPPRAVSDLNLTRMARHREEVSGRVSNVMKELELNRRKQTDLEHEKQSLEELSRKQNDYERGRNELRDALGQNIIMLEKQETQAVRLTELYASTRQRFSELLKEIENIAEEKWADDNFRDELNRASALIENARMEYNKARATLAAVSGEQTAVLSAPVASSAPQTGAPLSAGGFLAWLKIGTALVLPLGVLILAVAIVVYLIARGH